MALTEHLVFKPCPVVAGQLRNLGRTEDVVFSPDQTRLAIAGYNENLVLVLQIRTETDHGAMSVLSEAGVELHCKDFARPHGLAWIDDATLAVANRGKDVTVVPVPPASPTGTVVEVEPLLRLTEGREGFAYSPGSVAAIRLNDGYIDLLVCNNYRHNVSRHILRRSNGLRTVSEARLFTYGLQVPDGIAASSDGELVAISNHHRKRIDVFRNDADSGMQSRPAFSLGVPNFPHGVRFAMVDRLILVADAGAPQVHVFAKGKGTWKSAKDPDMSLTVMDDASFQRGHGNPEEGGPKGLDTLADGSLLVVTCEHQPIAFFDFRSIRDALLGTDGATAREARPSEVRLAETFMAMMKGQHAEIGALQAEVANLREKLKPKWYQDLDRRLRRWLGRAARKAIGPDRKH